MEFFETEAIQILSEVIDAVETLSLNDQDSWKNLNQKIGNLVQSVPEEKSVLKEGLDLCCKGIWDISESKIRNPLSLVDAIYDVLDAIITHLSDNSQDIKQIEKSKNKLLALLEEEKNADQPMEDDHDNTFKSSEPASESSLNDVAMMLIQLDQGDSSSVKIIKEALESIYSDSLLTEPANNKIKEATTLVEQIINNNDDWDIPINNISKLIDDAVTLENQKEFKEKQASEKNSDGSENDSEVSEEISWEFDHESKVEINKNIHGISEAATEETIKTDFVNMAEPLEKLETENMNINDEEHEVYSKKASEISVKSEDTSKSSISEEIIDDNDYMPEDPDFEMLGEFISESNDLISNAEEALLSLEVDPDDKDSIGMVFRAFHTVKGTAAFLELNLLSEMANHAENLLSRVRDNEIRYSGGYADLSLKALDMIKDLVLLVEESLNGEPLKKPGGYDPLLKILSNPEAEGISEEFTEDSSPRVGDILVATGKVKREDLEETVEKYADQPVGEALVKSKVSKVQDVGQALRTQTKLKGGQKHTVESTVRVSTKRLDQLVDMVGEIVIAHSMIAQDDIVSDSQNHALLKKVTQTGKIVRELQDLSMSMRMIPLKATFQKMTRLVRDVGRKVGKNVNLITEGEDTEIDRNLVDFISDPLVHMVRNSVDHGIETPEEREKIGKSPIGTIKLSAYHSAGNVVVEISDDGKGLNKELILQKAKERNLIEKGKTLTDKEIYNMIFEPGFSTAQTVTDVSGRGVGMDVVRKNIETLRGQVEINSEPGKGSVFKINLPLTLAIIDGMVIRVANESYVLPTESIVRSIKPELKDISTVFNEGQVLSIQGKLTPLFQLSELYDINSKDIENEQALVVIIEDDTTRAGIVIDELIGRQQVVVKSLGETMKGIPGISGGAIMPNGRVGLIVDVGGLIRLIHSGYEKLKEAENVEEMKVAV